MFEKLIWPIAFGLMFFLVSSKGGSGAELFTNTLIGLIIGILLSFALLNFISKPNFRYRINIIIAVFWGLILLSIGYPNLHVPGQPLNVLSIVYLILLSGGPLVAIVGALVINRRKLLKDD